VSSRDRFGEWLRTLAVHEAADASPAADCPDPSRIWDAVHGGAKEEEVDALLEHSLECPACAMAWRLARELSSQSRLTDPRAQRVTQVRNLTARRVRPAWVWTAGLAAAALLAVGGAVLWRELGLGARQAGPEQVAARWANLEVPVLELPSIAAAGDLVFRDGVVGGELGVAIDAYLEGDFAAAAGGLGRWVEAHPEDVQVRLLLAVALLKAGDVDGAVLPLEEVASLGAADTTADARYYLALAYLKRGEEGKARAQLQMISAGGGRWKAEAERLLPKLAGEGGGAR
jgi:hypothetical protein